jgi:hypothetical protein
MGRVLSKGWHLNASTPSKNSDAADHNNRHGSAESEKSPTARDLDSRRQPDRDGEESGSATAGHPHSGQPERDAAEKEKVGRWAEDRRSFSKLCSSEQPFS